MAQPRSKRTSTSSTPTSPVEAVGGATEKPLRVQDRQEIMDLANKIIAKDELGFPPVPNPGRAALFYGLWKAHLAGKEVSLDYRSYDAHWIVLTHERSSSIGVGELPFKIVATENGAIEYRDGEVSVTEMIPELDRLFGQPLPLVCDPPDGFSLEKHRALSRVAAALEQPFSRKLLVARLAVEAATDDDCDISLAHVKNWLREMVSKRHLRNEKSKQRPQYRVVSHRSIG